MSFNPVKDVTEGVVEGGLNWTTKQIKSLVDRWKHKELVFIQDPKIMEIVKEQYKSGELSIYKEYIHDKDILFLIKMGLTLKVLEHKGEEERRTNLRNKIFGKFKVKGLHVAQFVENGLLNRYIGILIDNVISIEKFKSDIMEILKNIEKYVLFVKTGDMERHIVQSAVTSTTSNSPSVFIISGISSAAVIIRNCEPKLIELLRDYELEKISSAQKENLFFKRILRAN
ncbi:MAG: hypothetical protein KJ906_03780 [Nanoarchaeota archaeon]|nr:hypothetical protein [Nanoarchaeota archaeon]